MAKKCLASFFNIIINPIEASSVPGVFHFAGVVYEGEKEMNFALGVAAKYVFHSAQIAFIHAEKEVILRIICGGKLPCVMGASGQAAAFQLSVGGWIDRMTQLFPAHGGRIDGKLIGKAAHFKHMFENGFSHRTAADVAVADKKNMFHVYEASF